MQNFIQPGTNLELTVSSPAAPTSGVQCLIGAGLTGVAVAAEGEGGVSAATKTMVNVGGGVYDLSVTDTATGGIAVGDKLWIHTANPPLINNVAASGYFFGYALEAIGSGLTGTINVLHQQCPGANTLGAGTVGTTELAANGVTAAKLTATMRTGFIPLDITQLRIIAANVIGNTSEGMFLDGNTAPSLQRFNGATDKALRVIWAANSVIECQFPPVPKPPDLDGAADLTVHLWMGKDANTDTAAVVDVQVFDGVGDTECGAATAALASATAAEYTATVTAANLGEHPGFLNISLVPGTRANDALWLYAAWIEYAKK